MGWAQGRQLHDTGLHWDKCERYGEHQEAVDLRHVGATCLGSHGPIKVWLGITRHLHPPSSRIRFKDASSGVKLKVKYSFTSRTHSLLGNLLDLQGNLGLHVAAPPGHLPNGWETAVVTERDLFDQGSGENDAGSAAVTWHSRALAQQFSKLEAKFL
ncbi:hypothetical protein DFH07DRAFT_773693 [Mycena maculata]|uniref:Uncharacterized protein n=1 Tax=Mycena maculata TaxID=230809 RepID=A0AAD7J159_9AGAR|nr:hypothetical protein DFH07DRAFT_773693 [Mycena maculata]